MFVLADDLGWGDVGWNNPSMADVTPHLTKLAKYVSLRLLPLIDLIFSSDLGWCSPNIMFSRYRCKISPETNWHKNLIIIFAYVFLKLASGVYLYGDMF